jgi:hypothetical protein
VKDERTPCAHVSHAFNQEIAAVGPAAASPSISDLTGGAHRLQERALGGLSPATRRLFERVVANAQARRPLQLRPVCKLEPGAVLIREWGGIKHRVAVGESGIGFGGKDYRSLSEVARVIPAAADRGRCSLD